MDDKIVTLVKAVAAGVSYGVCFYAFKKFADEPIVGNAKTNNITSKYSYPIWDGKSHRQGDRVIWNGHVWICVDICTFDEPGDGDDWRMIDKDLAMQRGEVSDDED